MSAMAILQQLYSRDYTIRRMLCRKWLLVVFAMVLLFVLSPRCAAGPIKRWPPLVGIVDCTREFSFASPSPFSQPLPFSPSPKSVFHLNGVVLTGTIAPPEFRTPDPRAASVTTDIFQALRWHPPCHLAPWLWDPSTMLQALSRTTSLPQSWSKLISGLSKACASSESIAAERTPVTVWSRSIPAVGYLA